METPEDTDEEGTASRERRRGWRGYLGPLALALFIALVLKAFLFQVFVIPSESMAATLEPGDRVAVDRLAQHEGNPARGDVVVFRNPAYQQDGARLSDAGLKEFFGVGLPMDYFLIKRVIGLPGEQVSVTRNGVEIDGAQLSEPYVNLAAGEGPLGDWTVLDGTIFMMGDNRGESHDSRAFGAVPLDHIVGRASLRLWPPSAWGGI